MHGRRRVRMAVASRPHPTGPSRKRDASYNPNCSRCSMHLGLAYHETNEHDEALQRQLSNFKKENQQ